MIGRLILLACMLLPTAAMAQQTIEQAVDGSISAITRNASALGNYTMQFSMRLDALTKENADLKAQIATLTTQIEGLKKPDDTKPDAPKPDLPKPDPAKQ